eukprot:6213215-Pleurochrysis_carterae.AAC.3
MERRCHLLRLVRPTIVYHLASVISPQDQASLSQIRNIARRPPCMFAGIAAPVGAASHLHLDRARRRCRMCRRTLRALTLRFTHTRSAISQVHKHIGARRTQISQLCVDYLRSWVDSVWGVGRDLSLS